MAVDAALDPVRRDAEIRRADEASRARLMAEAKAKGLKRFFESNYNVNYSARLFSPHYDNPWDIESQGKPHARWMDTPDKRVAIRTFSRGMLGAGLMTVGDSLASRYVPAALLKEGNLAGIEAYAHARGATFAAGEAASFGLKASYRVHQGLAGIAKAGDVVMGTPIRLVFGKNAVLFDRGSSKGGAPYKHTFGEEWVKTTFAFALGSVGDAWGRNIVGMFDPNVKKSWIHDGSFDGKEFLAATGRAAWRIFSFNQMEDWFAGPLYVYQRAFGQHLIGKAFPGAQMMLRHQIGGAAYKLGPDGKIAGNMLLPGILDWQWRFPIYNVDTLLFRDLSNHVKYLWQHRHDPEKPTSERGIVAETAKYGLKTTAKALTYMTPIMPFFWVPRVAHQMETPKAVHFDASGKATHISDINPETLGAGTFESVSRQLGHGPVGFLPKMFRPVGTAIGKVGETVGKGFALIPGIGRDKAMLTGSRYVGNAIAYTGYMDAKYETANWWDTPQMDAALYRVIDGVSGLSWKDAKAGIKDVGNVIARLPVSVETEYLTHESRGPINSTQQALDTADIRDGHLVKSLAQKQLENKILRQHAQRMAETANDDSRGRLIDAKRIGRDGQGGEAANDDRPGKRISGGISQGQMPQPELLRA